MRYYALTGGLATADTGDNLTASLQLDNLRALGYISNHQTANTITQNNTIAPMVVTRATDYVSSIATNADGQATVSTSTVNSGISVFAHPRIMRSGKIQLSLFVQQADYPQFRCRLCWR